MNIFTTIIFINILFADYGAGYAGSGLRYGSNAREFSLAGALVADNNTNFSIFTNPALLHTSKNNHLGISLQKMSLDRSIQSFSFIRNLPPKAGIGLALLKSGTNNIMGRDHFNNETEYFSSYDIEGIMSFGVLLGRKLAIGINIKMLFSSIYENYKGNGIGADLGLVFKYNRYLQLGTSIKNINAGYNWKQLIEQDKQPYLQKFPQNINLGITYSRFNNINLFFQEDIIILPNNHLNYRYRMASEFKLKNKFILRFGLKQTVGATREESLLNLFYFTPSLGGGGNIYIWKKQTLNIDYALDLGNVGEGLSHLFSFSIQF